MRLIVLLLLFALSVTACERKKEEPKASEAPAAAKRSTVFAPNPDGFRGLKWEDDITLLTGLAPVTDDSLAAGEALFTKEGEELVLDAVPVKAIEYRFIDGRFHDVIALLPEKEHANALKGKLFGAYGPVGPFMEETSPKRSIVGPFRQYLWVFEKGAVSLYINNAEGENVLLISSESPLEASDEEKKDAS